MILHVDLYQAMLEHDHRRASDILRSYGIAWRGADGRSDSDQVTFYGCENVPEDLPSFIKKISE